MLFCVCSLRIGVEKKQSPKWGIFVVRMIVLGLSQRFLRWLKFLFFKVQKQLKV